MRAGTCERCGDPFTDRSPAQKRRFCSDNCRKRHCDETTGRGACVECGGPMGARSRDTYLRCQACHIAADAARVEARARQIEAWWAEGLTMRQIANRLGWTMDHFKAVYGRLRAAGGDLPYRRSPEAVQHIRDGTHRWMAERDAA